MSRRPWRPSSVFFGDLPGTFLEIFFWFQKATLGTRLHRNVSGRPWRPSSVSFGHLPIAVLEIFYIFFWFQKATLGTRLHRNVSRRPWRPSSVEVEVEVEGEVEIDVEKEVEGQVGIELKVEVEVEREVQVEVEVEDSQVHKRDDSQVHKRDDSQVHKRVPGPCPTNLFYLQTQMMLCERPFSCTCSLRWCYANEFSLKYVDSDQKQQTVRVTSRFDTRQWFIGLVYSRKPGDWNVHLCALHGLCQRHNSPQPGICRYNLAHWKRAQLGNGKKLAIPCNVLLTCIFEKKMKLS